MMERVSFDGKVGDVMRMALTGEESVSMTTRISASFLRQLSRDIPFVGTDV